MKSSLKTKFVWSKLETWRKKNRFERKIACKVECLKFDSDWNENLIEELWAFDPWARRTFIRNDFVAGTQNCPIKQKGPVCDG